MTLPTPDLHQVILSGSLRSAVGGAATVGVEADTIRELLTRLLSHYPQISDQIPDGISVSINGEIYQDDWGKNIPQGAEVFLLPRIQGG